MTFLTNTLSKRFWLTQLLLLAIGACFVYMAFSGQDLPAIGQALAQAHYGWVLPVAAGTVLSHLARAWRWQLLLTASAPDLRSKPSVVSLFVALNVGYWVNFLVPRLGEPVRAYALFRTHQIPVALSLGTIVLERIIDLLCLLLAIGLAFLMASDMLAAVWFAHVLPALTLKWEQITQLLSFSALFALLVTGLLVLLALAYWLLCKRGFFQKSLLNTFMLGLVSGAHIKQPFVFLGLTLFIWLSYGLMTYGWFFSFEQTASLGPLAGWVLMVVGTVARTLPIQAGSAGAYHFLFMKAALFFGVAEVYGASLAVLIHGFQTAYHLLVGTGCFLWLLIDQNQKINP